MEEKCIACPKSGSTLELEGSWELVRSVLRYDPSVLSILPVRRKGLVTDAGSEPRSRNGGRVVSSGPKFLSTERLLEETDSGIAGGSCPLELLLE
jgi:hypothetical protein